jgi:hypothetical protein
MKMVLTFYIFFKMKTIFIATLLILSAFAVQDEATATFERMEKSHYGKTILDTIAL